MPKSVVDLKQKSKAAAAKKNKLRKSKDDSDSDEDISLDEDDEEDVYETCSDTSDSSFVPITKKKKNKKVIIEDEEDEEDEEEDEEDDEEDDDDESDHKYRKKFKEFLYQIFPSNYSKKRLEEAEEEDDDDEEEEEEEPKRKKSKSKTKSSSNKKSSKSKRRAEEDDEDEEEDDDDDAGQLVDILFYGGQGDYVDPDEYDEEDDKGDCDSEDERAFMRENYEAIDLPKKSDKKIKKDKKTKKRTDEENELADVEKEYLDLVDTKKTLTQQLNKRPKSKILTHAIEDCNRSIKKLVKKARIRNAKAYHKLIHDDKQNTNEIDYFKKKLSNKEQLKIMNELKEINAHMNIDRPYRLALLESKIPAKFKAIALQKLNTLRHMEPGDNEYYKIKNWVDTFMRIPFYNNKNLSITMDDGVEKCHEFMQNSMKILDGCVYGLNDAKLQILQMVGQWISNPSAMGTAIAIKGPMGTGKCHGYNTPILMYDGSVKMVQEVIVGDLVMGDDSTPRAVMSLGRGEDMMYEIASNKGVKYTVNSEHILCLKPSGMNRIKPMKNKQGEIYAYKTIYFNLSTCKHTYKTFADLEEAEKYLNSLIENQENDIVQISVKNYLKLPLHIQQCLKGYSTGVEFESKSILFDPYIIGIWLGDGCSEKPKITNQDAAILNYMRNELKKDNLSLHHVSKYDYNIVSDEKNHPHPGISKVTGYGYENKNIFMESLRHYDLINNKHIPHDYKTNDRNVRLQVLAGLIDSDGWYDVENRYFEITQKSKRLSDDILFLARSLGFAATQNECDKYCVYKGEKKYGLYYRVNIYGDGVDTIPTKCPRKQATDKKRHKNALVGAITVLPIGHGNYYGFELDKNHRYVLGNFAVTHNTTLVKEGISKILGREFAFIALGGAGDSSFLEGHSYTYEGSSWGKIVQILIDSKCMNPVIYFDELDKISDTPRGEEIVGILTHLTDTSQNSQFHDKYFSDIDFDLSKCLFIFSYNDESKVNAILKDRMYRIQTKGYDTKEKITIARNYILPKIREQVNFNEEDVIIPDDTIQYIASSNTLTHGEDGVRNLKRCLEIIYTKLNLFRLMKPDTENIFSKEINLKVTFPYTVTRKDVDIFIKNEQTQNQSMLAMYC
jgi:ATP-dependent Lon protease